jgi:hypothetical protein
LKPSWLSSIALKIFHGKRRISLVFHKEVVQKRAASITGSATAYHLFLRGEPVSICRLAGRCHSGFSGSSGSSRKMILDDRCRNLSVDALELRLVVAALEMSWHCCNIKRFVFFWGGGEAAAFGLERNFARLSCRRCWSLAPPPASLSFLMCVPSDNSIVSSVISSNKLILSPPS